MSEVAISTTAVERSIASRLLSHGNRQLATERERALDVLIDAGLAERATAEINARIEAERHALVDALRAAEEKHRPILDAAADRQAQYATRIEPARIALAKAEREHEAARLDHFYAQRAAEGEIGAIMQRLRDIADPRLEEFHYALRALDRAANAAFRFWEHGERMRDGTFVTVNDSNAEKVTSLRACIRDGMIRAEALRCAALSAEQITDALIGTIDDLRPAAAALQLDKELRDLERTIDAPVPMITLYGEEAQAK